MTKTEAQPERQLDKPQRQKVRSLVDDHFDDERGCYAIGWSDQRIGKEVGVPWALVTQLREAAYGPILIDPEVDALRNAISALAERIKKCEDRLEEDMTEVDGLRKDLAALVMRFDGIAAARVRRA